MNRFITFLLLSSVLTEYSTFAQQKSIINDNYFTTEKVYQKLIKTYPFIQKPDTTLPDNVKLKGNVVYKRIGNRELTLDIFSPINKGLGLLPCVLIFHGGGWRSGSKEMEHPLAANLSKFGIVAITVEYRLSPEAKYPAAVLDAKTAVRWIRKKSALYNIDTTRIFVLGASAGALLATLIGVTPNSVLFPKDDDIDTHDQVNGIINIDGEVDFTHPDACDIGQNEGKPSSATRWFGGNFNQVPKLWREASPINYISNKTPPIFFLNSSLKENHAGQEQMIRKLKKYKVLFNVKTLENTPHPFWLFNPWFEKNITYLVTILRRSMKIHTN